MQQPDVSQNYSCSIRTTQAGESCSAVLTNQGEIAFAASISCDIAACAPVDFKTWIPLASPSGWSIMQALPVSKQLLQSEVQISCRNTSAAFPSVVSGICFVEVPPIRFYEKQSISVTINKYNSIPNTTCTSPPVATAISSLRACIPLSILSSLSPIDNSSIFYIFDMDIDSNLFLARFSSLDCNPSSHIFTNRIAANFCLNGLEISITNTTNQGFLATAGFATNNASEIQQIDYNPTYAPCSSLNYTTRTGCYPQGSDFNISQTAGTVFGYSKPFAVMDFFIPSPAHDCSTSVNNQIAIVLYECLADKNFYWLTQNNSVLVQSMYMHENCAGIPFAERMFPFDSCLEGTVTNLFNVNALPLVIDAADGLVLTTSVGPPPHPPDPGNCNQTIEIASGVVSSVLIVVLLIYWCYWLYKGIRKRKERDKPSQNTVNTIYYD